MAQAMGFKGTGGLGKHAQGPSEFPTVEKRPKGLGLGATQDAPATEKRDLQSTFTPTIDKEVEFHKVMEEFTKGTPVLDPTKTSLPRQQQDFQEDQPYLMQIDTWKDETEGNRE